MDTRRNDDNMRWLIEAWPKLSKKARMKIYLMAQLYYYRGIIEDKLGITLRLPSRKEAAAIGGALALALFCFLAGAVNLEGELLELAGWLALGAGMLLAR